MTREEFIRNVADTQEAVRRFLLALCCGNRDNADDIAQETYIKAWINRDKFRKEASFATWIRKIAYNNFINYNRSNVYVQDEINVLNAVPADDNDKFRYEELYFALGKLTVKERTSILLFYMEGYSVKEIAEIEKTGVEAVKKHLSRGRNHLADILKNISSKI